MTMRHIGIAGWSIPKTHASIFPSKGSHLQRYAQTFDCVEINSSFYKEHQAKTYERWAASTPSTFRFSVKLSKQLTHEKCLAVKTDEIRPCIENILALGPKWEVLLVQLPPSLEFDSKTARTFMSRLQRACEPHSALKFALEPRHKSWATHEAIRFYRDFEISKVIADPERVEISARNADEAASAGALIYLRLHGSPEVYRSRYSPEFLSQVDARMRKWENRNIETWCIFDNTTFGHAIMNAIALKPRPKRGEIPTLLGHS